ncbi:MAG: glycosyltransferase family 1 protein [Nitrospira sp.]|nr:glycosyltransferase family 1 protein [Nitrospira sp.]
MKSSTRPVGQKPAITFCYRGFAANFGIRHVVASILEQAGYDVKQIKDGPADFSTESVVWIWGNTNWYPGLYAQLTAMPRVHRPLVVLWHTEPLPPPRAAGLPWPRLNWWEAAKLLLRDSNATDVYTNYLVLRRWVKQGIPDVLVAPTLGRCGFLSERGIRADWVPLGYEPSCGRDLGSDRDIEVLFLGAQDVPRRNRLLRGLRKKGIRIQAAGSYVDPGCWGEERTKLLNRTKILLNLARTPGEFPDLRLILGMANKALVLSEPIYRPDPFVSGRHFVSSPIGEMPGIIRYYLAHDAERAAISERAHRLITQDVTMEASVRRILDLISTRANQRAAVESAVRIKRPLRHHEVD